VPRARDACLVVSFFPDVSFGPRDVPVLIGEVSVCGAALNPKFDGRIFDFFTQQITRLDKAFRWFVLF